MYKYLNILFIHEVDLLKKPVIDTHLLAEGLSILGHNVYAIDYESLWKRGEPKTLKEFDISRAIPNSCVHLIRPDFIRVPVLSRISAFYNHYFKIRDVIRDKKIDVIILYSVPTNGLQAVYLSAKMDIPIIFRSLDVLNQLVPKPLESITLEMERVVYSSVDKILTITPKLSDYVVKLGAGKSNVSVLPVPVDTNRFYPSLEHYYTMRKQWGISVDDLVIMFMGTLYNFSGLDIFIQQLPYIIENVPNVKLLIVGDGKQRKKLESIIKELKLEGKVIITGFQPYGDMPKYINISDVCINPFIINDTTRDIFPGKTVQFMACGKPLVATPLNGMLAMIPNKDKLIDYAYLLDDAKSPYGFTNQIIKLFKSPKERKDMGDRSLEYVKKYYSLESVTKQLEYILSEMVGG